MSSTPLLLLLLTQFPQTAPPLASPALVAPARQGPIAVVGRPALTWRGNEWLIAWKDVRRATSPLGPATLFFTRWDGGAQAEVPQGAALGGPPMPMAWDDLFVAASQRDTVFAWSTPSPDAGVFLVARATDGGAALGAPFIVSQTPTVALPTLAGSAGGVLAAWYAGSAVHLYQWPTGARGVIDAGSNIVGLSAGEADGGFLLSWFGPAASALVTLVHPTTLAPLRSDFVGPGSLARVQVVGTPSARLVTTSTAGTTSSVATHFFNGSTWSQVNLPSLTTGSEPVLSAATETALVTTWSNAGRWAMTGPLHQLGTGSGQYPLAPLTLRNVAIDADGTSAVVLAQASSEVLAQRLTPDVSAMPGPVLTFEAPRSLLQAPATQRSPTATWFDPLSAFVVAWDEERLDGGFALMTSFLSTTGSMTPPQPLMAATSQLGFRPTLLRRPDGTAHGVQVNLGTTARSVYLLAFDGGVSLGPAVTTARSLTNAVMGNQSVLQWGTALGGVVSAWADFETSSRVDVAGRSPSCAAFLGGDFYLPIGFDGGVTWATVVDGVGVTVTRVDTSPQMASALCAAASATPQAVVVTWRTNPGFGVAAGPVAGGQVTLTATGSWSDNVAVGPIVTAVRSGDLIAWVTEGPPAANALVVQQTGATLGPVVLGRAEPATLAVASSPGGVGLVLWEAFDADAGARCVEARLIDVGSSDGGAPDAGAPDAGAPDAGAPDAGAPDAGAPDAGAPDAGAPDAGAPDAGAPDAGAPDAGAPDAGLPQDAGGPTDGGEGADGGAVVDGGPGPSPDAGPVDAGSSDGGLVFDFVPAACGCDAAPGGWLLWALGVIGLARRRLRGARPSR